MVRVFLVVLALVGAGLLLHWFLRAEPRQVLRALRWGGVVLAAIVAIVLLATGQFQLLYVLAIFLVPGLMRAFEDVQFVAPAYQGDYVRVTCQYLSVGNSSRRRKYEAHVVARTFGVGHAPTSGDVLQDPILIASATGTVVVRADLQRSTPAAFRKA
jgi:hypothetical protein